MIIEDRRSRIIGDFLEANALLVEKRTKSKLPKFISRVFYKKEVNKLIAMIRKLRESDYVLDAKELIELFTFINNNFDNHSYKSIIAVKVINNGINFSTIEAVLNIEKENIKCIIRVETNSDNFDLISTGLTEKKTKERIDITLSKLQSDNQRYSKTVDIINKKLREIMCDYILDIIVLYRDRGNI